jgi:two-component system, OmpR family, response regulator MprA
MVVHHKPRVLIAEDDPDTLVILRINLTAAGIEPMLAGDGRTALERIDAESPDALLLDVLLPGIDGWQVLEQLHAKGDPVPVIVCSGKDNLLDLQRARDLGAVAYLVKPFDIDRLIEVTSEVVGLRQAGPASERGIVGADGVELA